jgi:hypothetical protein
MARHEKTSMSTPPTSGPMAAARPPQADHEPIAAARALPSKQLVSSASVFGISIAAPSPCSRRKAMSASPLGASAQASEAAPKAASP